MKIENLLKRKLKTDKAILGYSLIFKKSTKTLFFIDAIENKLSNEFEFKVLNSSNKNSLIEQLKDMFIFEHEILDEYDFQEIQLFPKNGNNPEDKLSNPVLGVKKIDGKQELIYIQNYWKMWILEI